MSVDPPVRAISPGCATCPPTRDVDGSRNGNGVAVQRRLQRGRRRQRNDLMLSVAQQIDRTGGGAVERSTGGVDCVVDRRTVVEVCRPGRLHDTEHRHGQSFLCENDQVAGRELRTGLRAAQKCEPVVGPELRPAPRDAHPMQIQRGIVGEGGDDARERLTRHICQRACRSADDRDRRILLDHRQRYDRLTQVRFQCGGDARDGIGWFEAWDTDVAR